jgi:hypothetical protein
MLAKSIGKNGKEKNSFSGKYGSYRAFNKLGVINNVLIWNPTSASSRHWHTYPLHN